MPGLWSRRLHLKLYRFRAQPLLRGRIEDFAIDAVYARYDEARKITQLKTVRSTHPGRNRERNIRNSRRTRLSRLKLAGPTTLPQRRWRFPVFPLNLDPLHSLVEYKVVIGQVVDDEDRRRRLTNRDAILVQAKIQHHRSRSISRR